MQPRWWQVYEEENPGDGTDAGGGSGGDTQPGSGSEDTQAGAQDTLAGGQDTQPGADDKGAKDKGAPASMEAAIDQALGYAKKPDDKPVETPEEKQARETAAAEAKARKELDAKAAAGDPAAVKAKADADAKAKLEAAKPKDLKALELTPEQRKLMKAETAQRYTEVLTIAKTERARAEKAEAQITDLSTARDAIIEVLEKTSTTDEDLSRLLEYNRLTKSRKPEDLQAALQVAEAQALALRKILGKPGGDYDPVKDFPDLVKDVEDQKITLERAQEIAAARRREQVTSHEEQRRQSQAKTQRQGVEQRQQAEQGALTEIEQWQTVMAGSDIDFKAKEGILLPKITQIVQQYPPNLWLTTIKQVYEAIVVPKAALPDTRDDNKPLRPSGGKPGSPAPGSMQEAIDQGLGYGQK